MEVGEEGWASTDKRSNFIQDEDSVSKLAKTSNDDENAYRWSGVWWEAVLQCSISQSSPVSISTKIPSGTAVAGSHLVSWSDSHWSFGSGVLMGAVVKGSVLAARKSSPSAGDSGVVISVVTGSGCVTFVGGGWMRLLESSASPTVNKDPFVHSEKLMRGMAKQRSTIPHRNPSIKQMSLQVARW